MVTFGDIRGAIRSLKLSNRPLCVHSSLRSFGWVDGSASTVVDGLLAEGCTVLVPTFSWDCFGIPPPPDMQPERNGLYYEDYDGTFSGIGRVYASESMEIDQDMGAIPAAALAMPGRVRGNHPLCSFTAVGSLAEELIFDQKPLDVFAPLRNLAETSGSVLLMGVGLESMTFIHLAERVAGRNLFRRWANSTDGRPMMVEVGGCGGFDNFKPIFASLMREIRVGKSVWLAFPARETLEAATKAIRENPNITHCDNPHCGRCNDAVKGGPILTSGNHGSDPHSQNS